MVQAALRRANELLAEVNRAPILAHVTPHTLRRSYISFMLAAGHDLPYVQAQVGHEDPTTTLRIYAQVISQPNREQLRKKMRDLLRRDASEQPEPDDLSRLF